MRSRFFSPGIGLIILLLLGATHRLRAQDAPTFYEQLVEAHDAEDAPFLQSLISDNRLLIKPIVHELISSSLGAELSGDASEGHLSLAFAARLSESFEARFGERCLTIAVGYARGWTEDQKRQKLRADSLYAAGTAGRGADETVDQALADYEEALSIYREIGDGIGEGATLGGIGYIWFYYDTAKAIVYNRQALDVRRSVDDRDLIGRSLSTIGKLYYGFLGDYHTAIEYLTQAVVVFTEIGDLPRLASALSPLADSYGNIGQRDASLKGFQRAADIGMAVGDRHRVLEALHNIGITLHDLGRSSEAVQLLEKALVDYDDGEPDSDIGGIHIQLGAVYGSLGNLTSALENLQRAVTTAQQLGDDELLAGAFNSMGVVFLKAERRDRAMDFLTRALSRFETIEDAFGFAQASINLGELHFEQQDYARAEFHAQNALNASQGINNLWLESVSLILLGNTQVFQGRYEEALTNHQAALELSLDLEMPSLIFWSLLGFAESNERQGMIEEAIGFYEQAFDTLENNRSGLQSESEKSGFLSDQRYAYEQFIHFLTKAHAVQPDRGYAELAFNYGERARARSFLDLIAESLANVHEGVDPNLLQEQSELLSRLGRLRDELRAEASQIDPDQELLTSLREDRENTETAYDRLKREILASNPRYSELRYPRPSTLEDVQSGLLGDGDVLLEYTVGDSTSTLWTITRDDFRTYTLPPREHLQEQIELLRVALLDPDPSRANLFTEVSNRLYQLILEPAEAFLKRGTHLVIVPDDALSYLPFEALLTDAADPAEGFESFPYLIRKHTVSYGQSASVLAQLQERRSEEPSYGREQFLAFGDPVFQTGQESSGRPLQRLPFSREEVTSISSYFPEDERSIYLGEEASEGQLKSVGVLGSFRYIHLATHGLIDESRPDFSSVVLARSGNSSEDGYLQAAEIFNLKMNAELVVLSACETGLGRMVRGEGLVGLTRAFMYAGAPSVLVSLWSVADRSTSSLMEHFYGHLVADDRLKTEALRQAKLDLLVGGEFAHPFHWAPFVLIGDWY